MGDSYPAFKIVSLAPATGWVAVHALNKPVEGRTFTTRPVAVWAAVAWGESSHARSIIGLGAVDGVVELWPCNAEPNFLGFSLADDLDIEKWKSQALDSMEKRRR
ncbi:hypothetical protein U7230_13885 [Carboxydochorda subterranea]|uniref:Uncharacterized protein n=1 Tax=Carboxydichorda subterranea TaxID=3109565 RepID=A0ABZ1BYI2_9FIRM|nr:hypothetical protein [Limnochorda sp. L945t]WRP17158.1 hypothetical protein U7230_13885 [Limnochorda sp. L945t]